METDNVMPEFMDLRKFIFKKIYVLSAFFLLTPLTLIISSISLLSFSKNFEPQVPVQNQNLSYGASVFASVPSNYPSINSEIIASDARPYIIKYYLEINNSPLAPHYQLLVDTADKYGLDYRLLTSIAMKESGLCKIIPEGSHNCWGWGIHKAGTLGFDSYPEAIDTVSKGLREKYADIGLVTPDQIMTKYIPHSPGGAWAVDVNAYMQKLR